MAGSDSSDDWTEAGTKKAPVQTPTVQSSFVEETNPYLDKTFVGILHKLQAYHTDLLKINDKLADNPVEAGQYQGKLRLEVNRLFAYMNTYIDLQADISSEYARQRQALYEEGIAKGKSPSAAEKHAAEMTRTLAANEKIAKMRHDQVKNEWERYNGIAIYLATRMKEFNSERMMG